MEVYMEHIEEIVVREKLEVVELVDVYRGDSLGSGRGYSDDGLYVGYSGKGEGYYGSYRGYDKRDGGHKQVVQTVVYRNVVMGKEYL